MRFVRILFLGLISFGLMAGGAWAGNITYFGSGGVANTNFTLALEAMGTARNYSYSAASNGVNFVNGAALQIIPGQTLASGSLLTISFVNAAFSGAQVFLCEMDATNNTTDQAPAASATPSANATSQGFVLGRSVSGTNRLFVTTNGANSSNCSQSNGGFIYQFQNATSATVASVSYNVSLSGTVYDQKSAVNIANYARQFATAYNAGASTIDFISTNANGARFTGTTNNAAVGGNANIAFTGKNINAVGAAPNAALTVSALLGLQDSSSFQGVRRVYVDGASGGCALASNNAINNAPEGTTGNVNLSIPANAFNGTGGFAATVCADVLGNKVLQSRTIKAAYDISVSSGGVKPDQDLLTTVMTWTPNGYQGLIPYISTQSAFSTICIVSNKSTASATLTVDILSSQSGASLTSLSGLSLGSLAGQGTMRVDFASQITPYTFSGGVETPGTPIALTGLADRDRYSALINAGASPTVITINCIQNDPAGSKRMVPVLTQTSASNPFQQ